MLDLTKIETQFPGLSQARKKGLVLADGPGGAQFVALASEAVLRQMQLGNANLGGAFAASHQIEEQVLQAREAVAALINAPSACCISFGPNMTSLTFHFSRMLSKRWFQGQNIVTTELDHCANISPWQRAAVETGCHIRQAKVEPDTGELPVSRVVDLIDQDTALVAITAASNITGSLVELNRVVEKAHQCGALVYVDAVHLAPHQGIDVTELGCDLLVASGYKFFAPHMGFVYLRPDVELESIKVEPASSLRPNCFETGTLNFPALAGLTQAIAYLGSLSNPDMSQLLQADAIVHSMSLVTDHERTLSEVFLSGLTDLDGYRLYGSQDVSARTPTFALVHETLSSDVLAKRLSQQGVTSWSGHMYALSLINRLGLQQKNGVLRLGFMHYNTVDEAAKVIEALKAITRV